MPEPKPITSNLSTLISNLRLISRTLALLAILTLPTAVFAQGSLTPPGAPAPTMKSLDQIYANLDPRIPITNNSSAVTLSQPGSYYLTANLNVSSGTAITIATNGVTLDLNGFTVSTTSPTSTGAGILFNGGLRDVTICNGFIRGGVTNNGSGVYGGSGFGSGIDCAGTGPLNALVSRVVVSGCYYSGIYLGSQSRASVVDSCMVRTVGATGINATTVRQSSAIDCGNNGINAEQVFESRGESSGSGNGINASLTAIGCFGQSVSGTGINALNAAYCTGSRAGGTAIKATIANGCYNADGTNSISYKFNMP